MFLFKILIFFVELIKIVFSSSGAAVQTSLEVTHIVWFKIEHKPHYYTKHDYYDTGILELGLFGNLYPTVVNNFVELANATKSGVGYKGNEIYVGETVIVAGYPKGGLCTICGRYCKTKYTVFAPYGKGWLNTVRVDANTFTSIFFVTRLHGSRARDQTFGKVIRGMPIIDMISSWVPETTDLKRVYHREPGLCISDCGVKIPNKRFYVTIETVPNFS